MTRKSDEKHPTASLSQRIYDELRSRILTGQVHVGMVLNIDALASEFGTSSTPVRDALQRLSLEGLVKIRRKLGTIVTGFGPHEVRQANQLRLFLEPAMCEFIAPRRSEALIDELRANLAEWRAIDTATIYADVSVYLHYTDVNRRFHTRIAAETGNHRVLAVLGSLYVHPGVGAHIIGTDYQGPASRMDEHEAIIQALADRDAAGARDAMYHHLLAGRRDLVGFLTSGNEISDTRPGSGSSS